MNIRKFIAPTARQALEQIRIELGAEAMILSNRKTENGVEIIALANGEIEHLTDRAFAKKNRLDGGEAGRVGATGAEDKPVLQARPVPQAKPITQAKLAPLVKPVVQQAQASAQAKPVAPVKTAQAVDAEPATVVQENILSEIKSMGSMLQQQLATMHWNDVQQRDRSGPVCCAECSIPDSARCWHARCSTRCLPEICKVRLGSSRCSSAISKWRASG